MRSFFLPTSYTARVTVPAHIQAGHFAPDALEAAPPCEPDAAAPTSPPHAVSDASQEDHVQLVHREPQPDVSQLEDELAWVACRRCCRKRTCCPPRFANLPEILRRGWPRQVVMPDDGSGGGCVSRRPSLANFQGA